MINLPENEYVITEENGRRITFTTMRQKVLHTIGFNSGCLGRRLYTRHGKRYYKPYRNYFSGSDKELDRLVEAGYMDYSTYHDSGTEQRYYWFNRPGLDWLGEQIGIEIHNVSN